MNVDRLTVGSEPLALFLSGLRHGFGWYYGLRRDDGTDWPAGIGAELVFATAGAPITWTATVTGDRIVWDIPAGDVDTVLAAAVRGVTLIYVTTGGHRVPWGEGRL